MNQPIVRILCVDDEPFNLNLLEAILGLREQSKGFLTDAPFCLQFLLTGFIPIHPFVTQL